MVRILHGCIRRDSAPLWPAGHLPHMGGDQPAASLSPIASTAKEALFDVLPIYPHVGEMPGKAEGGERGLPAARRAWQAAAAVVDPEIPVVTVEDLGILRSVDVIDGVAVVRLTPTYSGCPAVVAIELAVEAALREAGFEARVERVTSPAWTTDWITPQGREKLRAYGIAPPQEAAGSIRALFGETEVTCPQCGARETERVSEFGSTACKALYRCTACREPFDYFKCI